MLTITHEEVLVSLHQGSLEIQAEFVWGSNYTFLTLVVHDQTKLKAVYKPIRGEQPLWDFPPASLGKREVAAYLVSEALGWHLVPPTVYRHEAPLGEGSLQLYVDHDAEYHYFNFSQADRQRLRLVALFDVLVNNADRKGSHIIIDAQGHLWLIDHGVCFHVEDKLRTVLWDFAGEEVPGDLMHDVEVFINHLLPSGGRRSKMSANLSPYISETEVSALIKRAERLLNSGYFPQPDANRRSYPWPPV